MSNRKTSQAIPSAISLPASVDGPSPSALRGCPTPSRCGPAAAHANLSATQARERGLLTSGTSGPHSCGSSSSGALQLFLENRLRAVTQGLGSTLYNLTWKPWRMPSGLWRSRLRASVRPASETGITGWPTPTTRDHKDGFFCPNVPLNSLLGRVAWLAGWPTPTASDEKWRYSTTEAAQRRQESGKQMSLEARAHLVDCGSPIRLKDSGQALTGSSAKMPSGGRLSPSHSRWLQGYPDVWDD